jgi:hypothetical protein
MRNKFNEAHRNPGSGLAGVVLTVILGAMAYHSPHARKAYNAISEYVNERVVMPSEYKEVNTQYSR